jgi:hypothetical protein
MLSDASAADHRLATVRKTIQAAAASEILAEFFMGALQPRVAQLAGDALRHVINGCLSCKSVSLTEVRLHRTSSHLYHLGVGPHPTPKSGLARGHCDKCVMCLGRRVRLGFLLFTSSGFPRPSSTKLFRQPCELRQVRVGQGCC